MITVVHAIRETRTTGGVAAPPRASTPQTSADQVHTTAPEHDSGSAGIAGLLANINELKDGKSAARAVKLASSFVGDPSIALRGRLRNYSAAGGYTNNCADFASAVLADTGRFKKSARDVGVVDFKKDLLAQGYKPVARNKVQPGDVAIILGDGVQHTELATAAGGHNWVGSNGTTSETISRDNLNWATGVTYLHR